MNDWIALRRLFNRSSYSMLQWGSKKFDGVSSLILDYHDFSSNCEPFTLWSHFLSLCDRSSFYHKNNSTPRLYSATYLECFYSVSDSCCGLFTKQRSSVMCNDLRHTIDISVHPQWDLFELIQQNRKHLPRSCSYCVYQSHNLPSTSPVS